MTQAKERGELVPEGRGAHDTAAHLRAQIDPELWAQAFVFAFVRNPYDRAVSGFCFQRKDRAEPGKMMAWMDLLEKAGEKRAEKGLSWNPVTRSQWEYVDQAGGIDNQGVLGRFENLEEDLLRITKLAGIPMVGALPHLHMSESRRKLHYREFLDVEPEAKARIERLYARDLEQFGYTY